MTWTRRAWAVALLAVAVTLGLAVWADLGDLRHALGTFPLVLVPLVLLLTVGNQGLRFLRWQLFLRRVDVNLPPARSASIFASGLAMILSPGKVGEVWKGWLVREADDTPLERTIPVVGAERLTDVLAVAFLSVAGLLVYGGSQAGVLVALVGLVAIVAFLRWEAGVERFLGALEGRRLVGDLAEGARDYYEAGRPLLAMGPLATALALSLAGWLLECVGTWLVLRGFGLDVSIGFATFVFSTATLLGALSFLPGGLGAAEASMAGLLVRSGIATDLAAASTLVVRAATLWFVALVALLVYATYRWTVSPGRAIPTGEVTR